MSTFIKKTLSLLNGIVYIEELYKELFHYRAHILFFYILDVSFTQLLVTVPLSLIYVMTGGLPDRLNHSFTIFRTIHSLTHSQHMLSYTEFWRMVMK